MAWYGQTHRARRCCSQAGLSLFAASLFLCRLALCRTFFLWKSWLGVGCRDSWRGLALLGKEESVIFCLWPVPRILLILCETFSSCCFFLLQKCPMVVWWGCFAGLLGKTSGMTIAACQHWNSGSCASQKWLKLFVHFCGTIFCCSFQLFWIPFTPPVSPFSFWQFYIRDLRKDKAFDFSHLLSSLKLNNDRLYNEEREFGLIGGADGVNECGVL